MYKQTKNQPSLTASLIIKSPKVTQLCLLLLLLILFLPLLPLPLAVLDATIKGNTHPHIAEGTKYKRASRERNKYRNAKNEQN